MNIPARSRRTLLCLATVASLIHLPRPAGAARADLVTEFEKSGGKRSPSYAETAAYLDRLRDASSWVRVSSFGTSPEGRALQLVVVDRHGRFTPERAHTKDNVVVLVQAGIHSGEIDGKDAGLMLIRAMAVEKSLSSLLDHVTLLFIPIFNVDGHERSGSYNRPNQNGPETQGFRATSVNLNLNRDYMKADAVEMRAWLSLFNEWNPDFFIDCHVTDGADYQYVVTYAAEIWPNGDTDVADWTATNFVKPVVERMRTAGWPLSPYINLRVWDDLTTGMESGPSTPRFSTGYCALRNRPALLVETHSLKDFETRVRGTYELLHQSLAVIGEDAARLRATVTAADKRSAALEKQTIPVEFDHDHSDSVMVDFLGVEYTVEKSDITGGRWVRYSKTPRITRMQRFTKQKVKATATVPAGYIVPAPWTDVIARVKTHGIKYTELSLPVTIDVSTYRFSNVTWAVKPFEGHHALTYDMAPVVEKMTFPAGSIVIDTAQPLARVAVHLLEPAGPDALVRWGFLDATFEQKEYFEGYVMEDLLRKMLAADPKLAADFEVAKQDSAFAASTERIRQWFYERSPYFDRRVNLYPIGRVVDGAVLRGLPVRQGRS